MISTTVMAEITSAPVTRTLSVALFRGARSSQPHLMMHFNWSNTDGS